MKKNVLLSFLSVLALFLFFLLPRNKEWFNERIIGNWNSFRNQRHSLDIEQRKIKRWGSSYTLSKQIANYIATKHDLGNALVLLPPSSYFKERKVDYNVPEPAVFYYYTGLKTTWVNSDSALKANWMVVADSGNLKLIPVIDKKTLLDNLLIFKKYPLSL